MEMAQHELDSIANVLKDLVHADIFIVAIISSEEHKQSGLCPHCNSDNNPILLDECMNLSNHIADLHLCADCALVFITVDYPTLYDTYHPVFLQFTMKPGMNPIAEVVASDMAKDLMAKVDASKTEVVD